MRYALVGFGRMGREIDAAAGLRGHTRALIVDRSARGRGIARSIEKARWRGIEVAFEFTEGLGARDRLIALLRAGVPVVCGTTGWDRDDPELRRIASACRVGAVVAPNYSVGVGLFAKLVAQAADGFARAGGYDPYVLEAHHRGKLDAPSGTARWLAGLVAAAAPGGEAIVEGPRAARIEPGAVHVASVRAGFEPGCHTVGFDGPHDVVTLTHNARGRSGFAEGAVLAAEWLQGRRGIHGFGEVCEHLLRGGRRGRRGGKP